MLSTRFICSLVLVFVHIQSKCAVFLFKLPWRGPHCSNPSIIYQLRPSITYRLRWSKTATQLSPSNSVLLRMQIYYITQRVASTPQWSSYTPSPFLPRKNKTATQKNSRMALLKLWGKLELYKCSLHVLFRELFLFLKRLTSIKYQGGLHNTLHQICGNQTPPWISVHLRSINHPV